MSADRTPSWLIIAALVLAEITSAFEVSMIFAAMPRFVRVFGDPLAAGWILTGCLLVSSVAAALCARLGDLHGRRRVLLIVLAACAIGSFVSAFSTSLTGVVIGTAIQGLSGTILPLCLGLASERLPREKVPVAVGIIVGAVMAGGGGGLLLGGWLVDRFDWHAIFLASGSFAIVGMLAIALCLRPRAVVRATRERMDVWRGILFAPGIVLLMYAIGQTRTWGLFDQRTLWLLLAGTLVLAYWARHQWRQVNPLIQVRLFAVPQIAAAYLCMGFLGLGAFQFGYVLSLFMQQPVAYGGLGLTATTTGLVLGPVLWAGILGGPLSGKISARYGAGRAALLGCSLLVVGWGLLLFARGDIAHVALAAVFLGPGLPIAYAALPTLIIEHAPPERVSEAVGLNSVVRSIFQAVGASLVAFFVTSDLIVVPGSAQQYSSPRAFDWTLLYVAGACALAMLAVAALRRPRAGPAVPAHA
ncbi:MFS transporter [Luteimonas sp. SDU101]|uniref:MFS transporter n=1 Tax=unclassified Luteimonas TaxID=2629088 RepID=UPI003EBB2745